MEKKNTSGKLFRSAGLISIATMLSRVLGLIREQVFAYFFGAGLVTDAFQIAFRIPNLLRDLFAEGSMSSALVPIYTKAKETEGESAAWDLVNKVISVMGVSMLAIAALGITFAENIVGIFPLEANSQKFQLTVSLTKIMIPFLPTVAFAAVWMSVLNARERFSIPALAPSLFNIVSIFSAFTLSPLCAKFGYEPIYGMAWGVILGGLGQWLFQYPSLRREGFRWRFSWSWKDAKLLKIIFLMGLGAVSMAATQVNVMVNSFLALSQGDGAVSWLNYAFRLMQFPIGVFGVAIAQVTLTKVSQSAARNEQDGLADTVGRSLRAAVIITLPCSIGLALYGEPIISLIFEYGRFTLQDTKSTALALTCYAVGLVAYSCNKVMIPVLYSLDRARLAVGASLSTVGFNIIFCFLLVDKIGFAGLALATSISSFLNLFILIYGANRKIKKLDWVYIRNGVGISVLASAIMGGFLLIYWNFFQSIWLNTGLFVRILIFSTGLSLAAGTYWIVTRLARLQETRYLEELLLRRLGR